MSPLRSRGSPTPNAGRKLDVFPNKGVSKQKWLPHPCLLGGPKEGGNAASPLHSRGSPTPSPGRKNRIDPQQRGKQTKVLASPLASLGPKRGRKCSIAPAFSGFPKATPGEENQKWSPTKGVNKQKWLPHPCLLGGPREGENATSPLHSWGSPTPSAGRKTRSVPQQRGKQAKVAASPLRSRGPKRGRKCYVTPAFSGVPYAKRKEENQKWSPTKG